MLKHYSSGGTKKIAIIAVAVVAVGALFYLSNERSSFRTLKPLSPEEIMAKQLEELDKLRQEAIVNSLTEEEKKKQLEELDKLKEQSQAQPLSQEEIDRQIKELDKLRSPSNN